MICKIQPPNPNLLNAVQYNENKMNGKEGIRETEDIEVKGIEEGYVLATRNVREEIGFADQLEELKMKAAFSKRAGRKMTNQTFHMSINPSEDDRKLTDKEAVELIDEIMAGLGYANQPYRIYKHTDIEREHYHVVSSRIDGTGKKINDSFERLVLREALKKLAPKYGFSVILSENEQKQQNQEKPSDGWQKKAETMPEEKETTTKKAVEPFSRHGGPVTTQMKNIMEDAMKWHYSTFEQIQALLLRRYNLMVEIENGPEDSDTLTLAGTDNKGLPITAPIREIELNAEFLKEIILKAAKEKMRNRREQRERLEKLATAAAASAKSYDDFKNIMYKKGVYVVLSFTKEREVFGLTYLDRATKCAWKGSETAVDLKWLKEAAAQKGWQLTKDTQQAFLESRQSMPSRKKGPKIMPAEASETSQRRRTNAKTTGFKRLRDDNIIVTGNRTHGSTAKAGDGKEERRKDIDDEVPVELVH